MFDTMDQQLFTLARAPAMRELVLPKSSPGEVLRPEQKAQNTNLANEYGSYTTSIFLIGWATGGLGFGVMGDRVGRARTMLWTIVIYSLCTGLSALSVGFADFAFYRFLTGLGVGGEFAVGVSLVAEVMPDRARPYALGLLQALSAVGNIAAAVINMALGAMAHAGVVESAWRVMFMVGTVPALLAVFIFRRLKEPQRWQAAALDAPSAQLGSYAALFGDQRWRRNAIVGMLLAFAGVVGLWGIGFFSYELISSVLRTRFEGEQMNAADIAYNLAFWTGVTSIVQNVGGFFGIWAYSRITPHIGRKPAFAIAFVLAMASTAMVFWYLDSFVQIFWMVPIMGFCQLALFGGYAIYFPELFPTRLRSTGTSFCYNVGRFVAAAGPSTLGLLTSRVYGGYEQPLPLRLAGVTMCAIFLLGLVVLPFAPETKGQPLPE
ncbi:MAG: MFS transporter [Planctomycetia bacterium]|nr:MFS transporter [Planctomycetia bacterium]